MVTTSAKKAGAGEGDKPVAKAAGKVAKPAAKPAAGQAGTARTRPAKAEAPAGSPPLVEKAHVEVKLKDLLDRVTAATGAKKPQVRLVVEAMLKEMGDALVALQVLNLPGLGKVRVVRAAETPTGTMTIKLRRGNAGAPGNKGGGKADAGAEPLAEPGEDS